MDDDENHDDVMMDDDDDSPSIEEQIEDVATKIMEYPNSYDLRLQLVALLRQNTEGEDAVGMLKNAREGMAAMFPLPPEVWLEWISDEKLMLQDESAKEIADEVLPLYRRATKSYLSEAVWLEYCDFVAEVHSVGAAPADVAREVFEDASHAIGSFSTEFWSKYVSFEDRNPEVLKMDETQASLVRSLYIRQLGLPLPGLEAAYDRFVKFEESIGSTQGLSPLERKHFQKAQEIYLRALTWENKIKNAPQPASPGLASEALTFAWDQYLSVEMESKEATPSRVQTLFERAIAQCFLNPQMWHKYVSFAERSLDHKALSAVLARAVQNVPYDISLALRSIRALENSGASTDEVIKKCEAALSSGQLGGVDAQVEFCLVACDVHRRALELGSPNNKRSYTDSELQPIRSFLSRAEECGLRDPDNCTKLYDVFSYQADFEGHSARNYGRAALAFENMLKHFGTDVKNWQDFISFERLHSLDRCRSLFKRALQVLHDGDSLKEISDGWVRFERQCGTLESLQSAMDAQEKRLTDIGNMIAASEAAHAAKLESRRKERREKQQQQKLQKKRKKMEKAQSGKGDKKGGKGAAKGGKAADKAGKADKRPNKRGNGEVSVSPHEEMKKATPKRIKTADGQTPDQAPKAKFSQSYSGTGANQTVPMPKAKGSDRPPVPLFDAAESGAASKSSSTKDVDMRDAGKASSTPEAKSREDHQESLARRTAFLKDIANGSTDDEIRKLFEPFGAIDLLSIPRYPDGACRGFGYVEFKEEESVTKAIDAMKSLSLRGKPLEVSHKRSEWASKSTVYVKSLPRDECNDELKKLFASCGEVREIRRPGKGKKLKGYCYVMFKDPSAVKPAIALSGAALRDKHIIVEECHGPKAKPVAGEVKMQGSVTSLMPASVARRSGLNIRTTQRKLQRSRLGGGAMSRNKRPPAASSNDVKMTDDDAGKSSGVASSSKSSANMSNDQFRKFLMKK